MTQEEQPTINNLQSATQEIFLGIDGGQSHTEAIIANRDGKILGRGRGTSGQTGKADEREGLRDAVIKSVGEALGVVAIGYVREFELASAHCAITGEAEEYKEEVVSEVLKAKILRVDHNEPAALYGATGGKAGIVVIAGTGSVAYGEDEHGNNARTGGWGHLFSDEGSGFWMAAQAVRRSLKSLDGFAETTLLAEKLLNYFNCADLRELTLKVYAEEITRDHLASFSREIHQVAMLGDKAAVQIVEGGARLLSVLAVNTAARLRFNERIPIAMMGGVFGSKLTRMFFTEALKQSLSSAKIIEARFGAGIGALILAYRAAGIELTEELLWNLETSSR